MTTDLITVGPDSDLHETAKLMVEEGISAVPVVDCKQELLGLVNEKVLIEMPLPNCLELLGDNFYLPDVDVYRKKLLKGLDENVLDHLVEANTFDYDTPITQIAATMIIQDIREAIILKDNKLVGIVSKSDIVRAMLDLNKK
nr:CBS domain-containing protein [Sporohalobacter salinus]